MPLSDMEHMQSPGPPIRKKDDKKEEDEWFPYKPGIEQDKHGRIRTNNHSPYTTTHKEKKPL